MPISPSSSWLQGRLSNLNYFQKFLIVWLFFLAALGVIAFFMIKAQNYTIHIAELELGGIKYQQLIRQLREKIPQHQILAERYIGGDNTLKNEIIALQSQIGIDFKNLVNFNDDVKGLVQSYNHHYSSSELSGVKPQDIEIEWNNFSTKVLDSTHEAIQNHHQALIGNLRTLTLSAGDSFHLLLDQEPNTYYLLVAMTQLLPNVQEEIPALMLIGDSVRRQKNISIDDRVSFISLLNRLSANTDEVKNAINKASIYDRGLSNNEETESKLKEPLREFTDETNNFLQYAKEKVLQKEVSEVVSSSFMSLRTKALDSSFILWDAAADQGSRLLNERIAKLRYQQFISLLIAGLCSLIGFLFGIYLIRALIRPLKTLASSAKHLTLGDLSTRVPIYSDDEVGQVSMAFNQIAESFQELISQFQRAGIQLTTSTTQIAATAKEQEATVVEQEATTKQIAATAREISSTAKDFAKTMNEVSNTAEQTSVLATQGKAGLNQMESIMRQMVEASANIASKLAVLNEKASTITSVITTISKVADQTNLLSLNASIEAEKAGEHGRSFSVIAREIRRLADQTANATLDIEKMVNEMVSAVSAGVMGVDKFTEEIHTGVAQASTVSEQLSKIIEQVQQQTTSFESVNQGMQAQTLGAEQINESINQLSESAQQTTESIRQFHRAIEQLNNAAKEMQGAVAKIKR
jgi:methyl-accepting chemotaxis protein WspA